MKQIKGKALLDVDIEKVVFADRYWIIKNFTGKNQTYKKRILKNWYVDFVYSDFSIETRDDVHTLCFRSLVRDDYKDLFHCIAGCIDEKTYLIEDYKIRTEQLNIEASRFLNANTWLFPLIETDCVIAKACLYIKLCSYLFVLEKVKKINFKRLVLFADMQPVENLLAQYFRKNGIQTVTLQHGLYVDYGEMDTVNVINYKHCVSDYFLAWGNNTKLLIDKYCPHTTSIICGKPKILLSNNIDERAEIKSRFCLIVLDQRIFDQQNVEMIQQVKDSELELDIYIKFHPSNNKKWYCERFNWIKEGGELNEAELVIGHTTSVIYEALALGIQVLKFVSNVPSINLPSELEFKTANELKTKRNMTLDLKKISSRYINCIDDLSLQKYRLFFNQKSF